MAAFRIAQLVSLIIAVYANFCFTQIVFHFAYNPSIRNVTIDELLSGLTYRIYDQPFLTFPTVRQLMNTVVFMQ